MKRPVAGDTIRLQWFIFGKLAGFREAVVEELHWCLGVYGEHGPKSPCNFTPLCELITPAPDSERLYFSNYGEYFSDYVQTYEIIAKNQPIESE